MSRGHGVWQRRIMESVEDYGSASITSLVGEVGGGRAAAVAARRAAKRLAEDGEVRAFYRVAGRSRAVNKLWVCMVDGDARSRSVSPAGGYPDWITRKCDSCEGRHSDLASDPLNCL